MSMARIFTIGEMTGDAAVQIYNSYVTCLNDRQRAVTNGDGAPTPVWLHHSLGLLPTGDAVVQSPLPQETGYNMEVQLQVVGLPQNLWVERRAGSPRQTHSVPVCSPPSRRVAPLRPRCAGLTAWTPAARTSVPALV